MQREPQTQAGTYIFGEKSKVANWLLNHPFHFVGGPALLILLVSDHDIVHLTRVLTIILFFFGFALLFRVLSRNWCYWVAIDTVSEKVTFYRCFNKGIVEAPIRSVKFVFDRHFAGLYNGERFTIFNEYMGEISEVIPTGVEIQFSDGFYGRFMKKQYRRQIESIRAAKKKI